MCISIKLIIVAKGGLEVRVSQCLANLGTTMYQHCSSCRPGLGVVSLVNKSTFTFKSSNALTGSIGPDVERARVCELWSDDADRPSPPAHRAACFSLLTPQIGSQLSAEYHFSFFVSIWLSSRNSGTTTRNPRNMFHHQRASEWRWHSSWLSSFCCWPHPQQASFAAICHCVCVSSSLAVQVQDVNVMVKLELWSFARWNEFGRSMWAMQQQSLVSNQRGPAWKYVAYVQMGEDEQTSAIDSAKNHISGKMYEVHFLATFH